MIDKNIDKIDMIDSSRAIVSATYITMQETYL